MIDSPLTKMTIGNQLKKARQKKQVTLNEAYQQTRIHPSVLTALEEDRFEQILSPTYNRSFLKEYAAYLGLDLKQILAEYDKLYPPEKVEVTHPSAEEKDFFPGIDLTKTAKSAGIAAAAIIGIIILIFLARGALRAISNISPQRAVRARQLSLAKTARSAEIAKTKVSKEKPRKVTPESVTKSVAPPPAKPPARVSPPVGEKLKLTITATDDVWIQLKVDGKIIFQNMLKKGSSEQWEANNDFTIWTGKAGAMQLNLNGNDLGTPGKGVIKNIVITREGIKK